MANLFHTMAKIFKRSPRKALKPVVESINNELNLASHNTDELEKQYSISSAVSRELEEWGSWFNVYRDPGEEDNEYRGRILSTVSTPKNTIPAIRRAVATYLSSYYGTLVLPSDVNIYEPHTDIIIYSVIKSGYSLNYRYPDSTMYRSHVIVIVIPYGATEGLKKLLQSIRPAGLRVYFDVQLVPEKPPGTEGSIPVDATHMVPTEDILLTFYMRALDANGFYHPYMEGETPYSGHKYLWTEYLLEYYLGRVEADPVPLPDPLFWTELLFYFKAQIEHGPISTHNVITKYMRADMSYVSVWTGMEKEYFLWVPAPVTSISEHYTLDIYKKLVLPIGRVITNGKELELVLSGMTPYESIPTYDGSIDMTPHYNDDAFNIRLTSAYTLGEIGDIPLSQLSWLSGAAEVEIFKTQP